MGNAYIQLDLFTPSEMWAMELGPKPAVDPGKVVKQKKRAKRTERGEISPVSKETIKASFEAQRPLNHK